MAYIDQLTVGRTSSSERADNCTTTKLAAGGTWAGQPFDCFASGVAAIGVLADSDVPGEVRVEFSDAYSAGPPVVPFVPMRSTPFPVFGLDQANPRADAFSIGPRLRWCRIRYTNGPSAQGRFKLVTTVHGGPVESGAAEVGAGLGRTAVGMPTRSAVFALASDGTNPDWLNLDAGGNLRVSMQGVSQVKGDKGDAATVAAGTTATGNPGTNAAVSNSGTSSAAVFDFTIPRGAAGAAGPQGNPGPAGQTGPAGTAATVAVGTTTTGAAGSSAAVTNSGTTAAAVFNFSVPRGPAGADGATGPAGPGGTAALAQKLVSAAYTLLTTDGPAVVLNSAASFDLTLPASPNNGQLYWVFVAGQNSVNLKSAANNVYYNGSFTNSVALNKGVAVQVVWDYVSATKCWRVF